MLIDSDIITVASISPFELKLYSNTFKLPIVQSENTVSLIGIMTLDNFKKL